MTDPLLYHLTIPATPLVPAHRLAYWHWGDVSAPRTLICVHGLSRNGRDFDFLAKALQSGWRIICPDMPGRGESEYFADPAYYTYPTYLADIMALLALLQVPKVSWVGTSMGGIIGMMVAATAPLIINKLVLNDIGASVPAGGLRRIVSYAGERAQYADEYEARQMLRSAYAPFGLTADWQWEHLYAHTLVKTEQGNWRLNYDTRILEPYRKDTDNFTRITDIDLNAVWMAVHCPTLILRGEESDILPPKVAQGMRARSGVTLVEFPNVGHAPALMDPHQIKIVTDWLG